eukprot:Lankesteria_metandrocarpae@DN4882_c0_g1_i3.p1
MVTHTQSGGDLEVMGLMQGLITKDTFVITDTFALPVEVRRLKRPRRYYCTTGTETRVNAGAEASEYMVNFHDASAQINKHENIVGWYHSHPDYGCWLSGIDVATQKLYQTHNEPFVAIVIDPIRTLRTGTVDIGAFRTLIDGSGGRSGTSPTVNVGTTSGKGVPSNKLHDFGAHWREYYNLSVAVFKSDMDVKLCDHFWRDNWMTLLGSSVSAEAKLSRRVALNAITRRLHDVQNWKVESPPHHEISSLRDTSHSLISELEKDATTASVKLELFASPSCKDTDS